MVRATTPLVIAALAVLGCSTDDPPGANRDDPLPPELADAECPSNPDCFSTECDRCPDYWVCQELSDGGKRCSNPGPDYPDDGDWECEDVGAKTVCRGDEMPDDGGSDGWRCVDRDEFAECTKDRPDYPDGGGDDGWNCYYRGELRVCSTEEADDEGDDGYTPPPPDECVRVAEGDLEFGKDEISARSDRESRYVDCTTVEVAVTGYYALYDAAPSESCTSQLDETGFLTVTNSCNPDGLPLDPNVGDYLVVEDVDNTNFCDGHGDCEGDMVCREDPTDSVGHSQCCVPDNEIYMGTFLFKAGETNELCVNHWCPLWRDDREADGMVNNGCDGSPNSLHILLDGSARVCLTDEDTPDSCP